VSWQVVPTTSGVALAGELRIGDATKIWDALRASAARARTRFDVDLSRASAIDGAVLSLLVSIRSQLAARGIAAELVGVPAPLEPVVHLYHGDVRAAPATRPPKRANAVARFGGVVELVLAAIRRAIEFIGELAQALAAMVRHAGISGRDVNKLIVRAGTDGIPIIVVLNFLVGFVMAYQSTRQLQSYGANLYVADVVGISMTRELAPLITATIITGRSGAAYAAELGTMRVSEEIDALRTMGLSPMPYLVVPRIIALLVAAPILTLLGDVAGTLGGLVVGTTSLGVHPHAYLTELRDAVEVSDVWTGLVKAVAFGGAIAIIGCQQGLTTRGAASGVGRSTTATVVACLFTLVIIDTALTVVFRSFDV
jgi:phospholipid/cholesterol/gamma-HCH transport system permease protein